MIARSSAVLASGDFSGVSGGGRCGIGASRSLSIVVLVGIASAPLMSAACDNTEFGMIEGWLAENSRIRGGIGGAGDSVGKRGTKRGAI